MTGEGCSHNKLSCCHSSEALLLLLSRTPWRLSIKELSEITHFHRNTIRPTLKFLKDEGKIKSIGENKNQMYYYGGVIEFYRRMAKSLDELDLPTETIHKLAEQFSYNLVKETLSDALEDGPEFTHESLYEALVHIKMAYPFSDIKIERYEDDDGNSKTRTIPTTIFTVPHEEDNFDPSDFNLRVHSCLCRGEKDFKTSCNMVIGALKGAIEGSTRVKAKVEWIQSGNNENGQFCEYRVIGIGFIPSEQNLNQNKKLKHINTTLIENENLISANT